MPEWLIFIFILFIIYLAMKKPTSTTEKTVTKVKAEKPAATAVAGVKPKKSAPAQKAAKKEPAAAVKPKPEPASSALPVSERVGLTAGSIWRYLSESGATPVTKLVKDLPEEEKIIQRSIGWLAQEGKITLNISDRIETIALK